MIDAAVRNHPTLTLDDIDTRITFHDDIAVMEADFSGVHFFDTADVNAFYDRLEERIAETGEDLWFFLVNYSDSKIDPEAWFAFSRRGKTLNMAHSMGSVRFDASEATRRQIERDAGTENFDANLFADRDKAIERLKSMPSKRLKAIVHAPTYSRADFEPRVRFLEDDRIMEIDLSDLKLHHSRDVDDLMDYLQERIEASGRRWYFLINYNNCHIDPAAWVQWAKRGKELNVGGSLGTVRYEAGSETEADIRLRAETQGFRPNIRNTREEALERIAEMKAEADA
ncbi:MAG: hypothetical protein QNJ44_15165 [Rhodobacter sp.]|nr:hypothetical protein [Rhodobacter sp.]